MKTQQERDKSRELTLQVSRRLVAARDLLGISRERLMQEYGLYNSKLSQWELGVARPDTEFLIQLCEDYGLSLDWFFRGRANHLAPRSKKPQPVKRDSTTEELAVVKNV